MQDLVKATGLHPGSLYGAFSNKENLFNECIKSDLEALFNLLENIFSAQATSYDGLVAYCQDYWNDALLPSEQAKFRFLFKASLDVDEELPESARIIKEAMFRHNEIVTRHIEQAQTDGKVRTDFSASDIKKFLAMGSLGLRCMQQQQLNSQTPLENRCVDIMLDFIKA